MNTPKTTTITTRMLFAISVIVLASQSSAIREIYPYESASQAKARENTAPNNQYRKPINESEKGNRELMGEEKMQLGNFSISLAVKDIKASIAFYEKLDFRQAGGNLEHNYVIMQNDTATIGLFQGMFEKNILTFNPGWNRKAETLEKFQDIRELQATIKDRGIAPVKEADAATDGPASFVIVDPDGNSILVDQHVPRSKK